ncbi:MAG TPA: ribosome-associated translation inhibitor RaiA [Bryobacteraceae bacterium]|jgi:putative sigma-54 modulation protein|nr:ribosome-associated translation inhibitor RaiA [Bryobacteraceae bacterium]
MKLIVSGKTKDFTPELEEKVTAKIAKFSKMIEQRGEREAHVTHQVERHLHRIEVIVNFYDHVLVGEGLDADLDAALCHAVEKLEKQVVKLKNRWRDTHRDAKAVRTTKESWEANGSSPETAKSAVLDQRSNGNGRPKIFHVDYNENRKPMTLEEALLEMQRETDDYVVYRDSSRNCLSVLVRRPDGNFDLIES